jgi:aspartate-semialdehyde dehydrogenase
MLHKIDKLCIVGATGLVGGVILQVLAEFNIQFNELILCASANSLGKNIVFKSQSYSVISIVDAIAKKPNIAIFSAGSEASLFYAPLFANQGTTVIDNSSAWRMDSTKLLIVPEVNGHLITKNDKIISNPNCSTIQLVVALQPLHHKFIINRLVISTYQAVTGTGVKGVQQLMDEAKGINDGPKAYPHPINLNCIPHGGSFETDGYTSEEKKLENETKKIMNHPNMAITATVVRVPVMGGHSESVNISFEKPFEIENIKQLLATAPGILFIDNIKENQYPTPLIAQGKNEVLVGRVRRDNSIANGINMWIVSDNLRKGAATNALQIAQLVAALNS